MTLFEELFSSLINKQNGGDSIAATKVCYHSIQRVLKIATPFIAVLAPQCTIYDAGWSSPVARWAHNPKVDSSNLSPATNLHEAFGGSYPKAFLFLYRFSIAICGPFGCEET